MTWMEHGFLRTCALSMELKQLFALEIMGNMAPLRKTAENGDGNVGNKTGNKTKNAHKYLN